MRRDPVRLRWSIMAIAVALVALALPTMNAAATEARVVVAGSAPVPTNVTVVHQAITTTFDVTLSPRSTTGLANYIASLSDTASANYRHYLTTAQFARRFGASASSVTAVRDYFDGFGLHVGGLSRGHLVLHVKGSTTDIARAFAAGVETIRRSNGVLAAQLDAKGTVPSGIAHHIAGIAGLSSVVQPSPSTVLSHASARTAVATTCPADGGETTTTPNANGVYPPLALGVVVVSPPSAGHVVATAVRALAWESTVLGDGWTTDESPAMPAMWLASPVVLRGLNVTSKVVVIAWWTTVTFVGTGAEPATTTRASVAAAFIVGNARATSATAMAMIDHRRRTGSRRMASAYEDPDAPDVSGSNVVQEVRRFLRVRVSCGSVTTREISAFHADVFGNDTFSHQPAKDRAPEAVSDQPFE